jgi:alpha-L-fucosidase 2
MSRVSRRDFLAAAGAVSLAPSAEPGGPLRLCNRHTLYSDEPGRSDLPLHIAPEFDRVEAMLRRGEYAEAVDIITRQWGGRAQPCYQPLGDLRLYFNGHTAPEPYTRDLDIGEAVASVRYTHEGVEYGREYFASFPDQAIVIRLTASKPGRLDFRASLSSIHPRPGALGKERIQLSSPARFGAAQNSGLGEAR